MVPDLPEQCREVLERLVRFCLLDPELEVPNRTYFELFGKREMEISRRLEAPLSVLFVDLDGLKKVNDTYGHAAGDCYLAEVAQILKSHTRGSDLVVRWGGDEFVIFLHAELEGALKVKERIKRRCENTWVELGKIRFKPSVSIGVAEVRGDLFEAIARADEDMYREKRSGRLLLP